MFNVNPSRMFRNKAKLSGRKLGWLSNRISLKKKPTRKPTHQASKKRRAKSERKARMFGLWVKK